MDSKTGIITTVAGRADVFGFNGSGDGGLAINALLGFPFGLVVDASGNLLIADYGDHRVRKVNAKTGVITTVAGGGPTVDNSYSGDGGPATDAYLPEVRSLENRHKHLSCPAFAAINISVNLTSPVIPAFVPNAAGNLYFAAVEGSVWKFDASTKVLSHYAGNRQHGFSGDDGPAIDAEFGALSDIAVQENGTLLIADPDNHRVRVVTPY